MNLFLAPHPDDETLFGAYTLVREKPLVVVVTDSWIQFNRGDSINADQRWNETVEAMHILGCPAIRLGIRDDIVDMCSVVDNLQRFVGFETVYAPAIQNGNPHHDLIGAVARLLFEDKVKQYSTYASGQFYTPGTIEIKPTPEEVELKNKALYCYVSQINLPATAQHFSSVRGLSEWLI